MRTKHLLYAVIALVATGGLWTVRAAWRAHHRLVTLSVRELPLREVLRRIEKQTWTKIRAQKELDARVTLDVKNEPLPQVLDRIAEQAGAHWSRLYAIYRAASGLEALDSALRADGKLEPAGWKQIAPDFSSLTLPEPEGGGPVLRPGVGEPMRLDNPAQMADPIVPGDAGGAMGGRSMMLTRRTEGGPVVFFGGPAGQKEIWSPEELVIEASLSPRLGNDPVDAATPQAAVQTARKVRGRWTTYFAFSKSSLGFGFGAVGRPGVAPIRRDPNDRFARLTPEQRVQRARQRLEFEKARTSKPLN